MKQGKNNKSDNKEQKKNNIFHVYIFDHITDKLQIIPTDQILSKSNCFRVEQVYGIFLV